VGGNSESLGESSVITETLVKSSKANVLVLLSEQVLEACRLARDLASNLNTKGK
jgi:hypothetical protein